MRVIWSALLSVALLPVALAAQLAADAPAPRVGPARGTVVVVGGGSMGPEIYDAFIDAAGGPDALILLVPNAGGADAYPEDGASSQRWKAAGARNVRVLFTKDRKVADSDAFVAPIREAGGVWFEGGRQFRLVDAYAGTKTEAAFGEVLARGGVVGGSSAGASILGDFLVRGAPSNNNRIMDHPDYQKGFAYLRGVAIDQHVVARERLPDLADSIITTYPRLLGISEDEGTAWVVRGDTGTIVGRSKAFVYASEGPTDDGAPFLTLHPGDSYDLGARRVIRRAGEGSPLTRAFIEALFASYAAADARRATVLVAQDGKVVVDRSFGIPPQPRYMPTTTVPTFDLGEMSRVFEAICAQLPEPPARTPSSAGGSAAVDGGAGGGASALTSFQRCVARQAATPVGLHNTSATADGLVHSSVDELYRVSLGLEHPPTYARRVGGGAGAARPPIDGAKGWEVDRLASATRYQVFTAPGGKQGAWVRIPERRTTVIILTNDPSADARGLAASITGRLFPEQ